MARSETARPFGERKQRLVLYVGLLFAALAAVLVVVIAGSSGGGGGGSTQSAVVASQDIPADTRVTAEMLEIKFLNSDEVTADAFTARSQVIDRETTAAVVAGQQFVPTLVSDKVGEGLAFTVSPGMRALSINVQEVVTAGGNVEPGDKVDIIGVFRMPASINQEALNSTLAYLAPGFTIELPARPEATEGEADFAPVGGDYVLTVTLVQDLKVLGVAQSLVTRPVADSAAADSTEEAESEPGAVTATLELTPDQAQKLTLSDEYAILRMAARGVNDVEVLGTAPVLVQLSR
jgi:Flp pilus assembly protein CpaB